MTRIRDLLRLGAAKGEERALTRQTLPPSMLADPSPGDARVTASNALTIADAYACVRALSDAAASLPLIVYRRLPDGGRRRLDSYAQRLIRTPAPAVTEAALTGQIVAHLATYGNSYVGKFRDEHGRIVQLRCLPPERVEPELKNGEVRFTVTNDKGQQTVHGTEDVTHVKTMSTDGLTGLSPVKQTRLALGLADSMTRYAASFFANDATPRGILRVPGGAPVQEKITEAFLRQHSGTERAHRIAVFAGQVEYQAVSLDPEDAQFLEQRQLSSQEIARIFRVPPWIIGAPSGDSMTYSNTEQQGLHFVTYSLRPYLVAIEQALTADRDLFAPNTYCEYLLDALLRADTATRAQVYTAALDPVTGWMSRDEIRKLENLDPETTPVPRPHLDPETTPVPTPSRNGRERVIA